MAEKYAAQKRYYERHRQKVLERQARYREENREAIAERNRRYRRENPEKIRSQWHERDLAKKRARNTLNKAIKRGAIVKGPCAREGDGCRGQIEAHHPSYDRPLDVVWFCTRHHREVDGG